MRRMDDASLDEFLDSEDGETSDGSDTYTTAVEPATVTLQWSPAGGDCEACGTRVKRRWQSETGLVCAECTEW